MLDATLTCFFDCPRRALKFTSSRAFPSDRCALSVRQVLVVWIHHMCLVIAQCIPLSSMSYYSSYVYGQAWHLSTTV